MKASPGKPGFHRSQTKPATKAPEVVYSMSTFMSRELRRLAQGHPRWLVELFFPPRPWPAPQVVFGRPLCSPGCRARKSSPGQLNSAAGGNVPRSLGQAAVRGSEMLEEFLTSVGGPAEWVWGSTGHEAAPESPEPRGPALSLQPICHVTPGE